MQLKELIYDYTWADKEDLKVKAPLHKLGQFPEFILDDYGYIGSSCQNAVKIVVSVALSDSTESSLTRLQQ